MPAESMTSELRLVYELKRRRGGKSISIGWNGLAWRAVIRVARMVGGRGDSGAIVSIESSTITGI